MANVRNEARPLSPHLSIWKWGPGMTVSIVHRVTGTAMATGGTVLLVWWLVALGSGAEAYDAFRDLFTYTTGELNAAGWIVGIGLTWVFFQHMASGTRHLFLDQGANFELGANKRTAIVTFIVSVIATAAFWFAIWEKTNG